jgi:hypothetical protein
MMQQTLGDCGSIPASAGEWADEQTKRPTCPDSMAAFRLLSVSDRVVTNQRPLWQGLG